MNEKSCRSIKVITRVECMCALLSLVSSMFCVPFHRMNIISILYTTSRWNSNLGLSWERHGFFLFHIHLPPYFPGIPVHFSGIQIYVYKIEFIYTQTECDCVRTWLKENLLFELGIIKMECYIYFGRTPWKIERESKKCELMAMVPSSRIHFNGRVRELWNLMKDSFILAVIPVQIT